MGVSSAGAVRVGQAIGRGDRRGAAEAGWAALALGAGFMALAGLTFVVTPRPIITAFTRDAAVVAVGVSLLRVAAAFQLFDGLQVVTTGVMRGLGDTRTPMLCNLAGHWGLGLPLGYALCFGLGLGVVGVWMGLSAGLIAVGAVLLAIWTRRVRRLKAA
jgi:MATE family multidrug resistance protein